MVGAEAAGHLQRYAVVAERYREGPGKIRTWQIRFCKSAICEETAGGLLTISRSVSPPAAQVLRPLCHFTKVEGDASI